MDQRPPTPVPASAVRARLEGVPLRRGLLTGMRIRKKLVVLHTVFSLALAAVLVLALRPAVGQIVREAEGHQARLVADLVGRALGEAGGMPGAGDAALVLRSRLPDEVTITAGDAGGLGLAGGLAGLLSASAGKAMVVAEGGEPPRVLVGDGRGAFVSVLVELQESRRAVGRLYGIVVVALLAVYGLIAFALEVFILPRHVWRPIAAVLEADQGVRENDRAREIIPERFIPGDELGQIMRS
ncbi:MAG: hypothetical protein ACK51T_05225, partial [bacterium]